MTIKAAARKWVHRAVDFGARRTIFSTGKRMRSIGFDIISKHQALIACGSASERFVVKAGDEWIGRGLFVDGEFDFSKFVAALARIAELKAGWTPELLVDVGANIGTICIPAVARGLVGRALAIEPDPDNSRLLRANIMLNGLETRIRTVEAAAGPRDGETLELELSGENFGDHRIRVADDVGRHEEGARAVVEVPSARLDTIAASERGARTMVWMDVQGYEGHVLAGSAALLAGQPPLVLEFCPYLINRARSFEPLTAALASYAGFVDLDQQGALRPVSELGELFEQYGAGDAFTDILLI